MESWTIIILGATGDLSRKRLIPALYSMLKHKPQLSFVLIGAAKDDTSAEALIRESIPKGNDELVSQLIQRSTYKTVDFNHEEDFRTLSKHITQVEKDHHLSGNRLLYFAVASEWYCKLTHLVTATGIVQNKKNLSNKHHRVVYEKPFGFDTLSAQEINACIASLLEEEQIYRVDHYLTKALTTSLVLLRFSNVFFEPVWDASSIDQVHILLSEKESVTGRGGFYDAYGALKDVVQNHMFELMALVGMERPRSVSHQDLSAQKTALLRSISVTDGLLGQSEGYRNEKGVNRDSLRETFALLRCILNNPRWHHVPFYLKTGKSLAYKSTEIHVVFKPLSKSIIGEKGFFEPNRLVIRISPDSGFTLTMNTRVGLEHETKVITMDFCYRCSFGLQVPHSYETLFLELFAGDKSITVSPEEIHSAWEIIDQVEKLELPLYSYKPASYGPPEIEAFTHKYAIAWQEE